MPAGVRCLGVCSGCAGAIAAVVCAIFGAARALEDVLGRAAFCVPGMDPDLVEAMKHGAAVISKKEVDANRQTGSTKPEAGANKTTWLKTARFAKQTSKTTKKKLKKTKTKKHNSGTGVGSAHGHKAIYSLSLTICVLVFPGVP